MNVYMQIYACKDVCVCVIHIRTYTLMYMLAEEKRKAETAAKDALVVSVCCVDQQRHLEPGCLTCVAV